MGCCKALLWCPGRRVTVGCGVCSVRPKTAPRFWGWFVRTQGQRALLGPAGALQSPGWGRGRSRGRALGHPRQRAAVPQDAPVRPRAGCLAWKVGVAGRSLCPITWICEVVPTNGPQVPRPSEGSLSP